MSNQAPSNNQNSKQLVTQENFAEVAYFLFYKYQESTHRYED